MLTSELPTDLDAVRQHTRETIREACAAEERVLVEAPPSSGKSTTAYELARWTETPVTYLAGRTDLYEQAIDWCEEQGGLSYEVIPSPHRDCPTFRGETSTSDSRVKRLYNRGQSGRKIHYEETVDTPCMSMEPTCPYLEKLQRVEQATGSIDLLIGNHKHGNRPLYIEDRLVVLDEFNPDPFLTRFPSAEDSEAVDVPGEIIRYFLTDLENHDTGFPTEEFNDLSDFITKRDDVEARARALEWFQEHGIERSDAADLEFLDVTSYRYDATHVLAPFLTCSLLCMEKVAPGIGLAPPPEGDRREAWLETGVGAGTKCVRDRNTGEMYVLRPPNLEPAAGGIGLDAIPTVALWNVVFGGAAEFEHRQIIDREDLPRYLKHALKMEIIQLGGGMHHYAGGRMSAKDEQRFAVINARESGKPALISTKKVIERYAGRRWLGQYLKAADAANANDTADSGRDDESGQRRWLAKHYATVLSSNEFEREDLGAVFGSPFPGDDVIERWAGFCGEAARPEGAGADKTFGSFGDEIYHHFTHHQVIQALLRFGRHESVRKNGGSTVYLSTEALPEWFEPEKRLQIRSETKGCAVIEALIDVKESAQRPALAYQTAKTLQTAVEKRDDWSEGVTQDHVRSLLADLESRGLVQVRENAGRGGANLYRWDGDGNELQEMNDGSPLLAMKDTVYILEPG